METCLVISISFGRIRKSGQHTAMTTQHMLMYGLSLSPIRAHFQKTPVILATWLAIRRIGVFFLQSDFISLPILIPVEDARRKVVDVCACADEQQDNEEERLEVE